MNSLYQGLIERIRGEVSDLDAVIERAMHLVQQMVQDRPDLRPAVISPDNATVVDEFRRFRHLVRNVYTTSLEPDKMNSLMTALPKLWPKLKAELLAFADYLDALSQSLQDPE